MQLELCFEKSLLAKKIGNDRGGGKQSKAGEEDEPFTLHSSVSITAKNGRAVIETIFSP